MRRHGMVAFACGAGPAGERKRPRAYRQTATGGPQKSAARKFVCAVIRVFHC